MSLRPPVRRFVHWYWAVATVIAVYYAMLFGTAFNLPKEDDYDAILGFMNGYTIQSGWLQKLRYLAASQHNEYKLYLEHIVAIVQHAATGSVNFAVLQCLGDLAVLGIFAVVAANLAGAETGFRRGFALLPLAFLIFSLRSHDALNFAMSGLQNMAVLLFALLALHFLVRVGPRPSWLACIFLLLAIASSGNGFVLLVTGAVPLMERRRWRMLLAWWLTGAGCALIYAYHYTVLPHGAVPWTARRVFIIAAFPFTFLGNALPKPGLAFPFGVILFTLFVFLVRRGMRRQQPFAFHTAIFVLCTALGVTFTRNGGGWSAAVPSRYALYGLLFCSMVYLGALTMAASQEFLPANSLTRSRQRLQVSFAIGGFLLWCPYVAIAGKSLHDEKQNVQQAFFAWKEGKRPDPVYFVPQSEPLARAKLASRAVDITLKAEQLHVFTAVSHPVAESKSQAKPK